MSFESICEFLYDVYHVGHSVPLALIKKHPKGYMWHTYDKWALGKKGKLIRHRSPVYEQTTDAVASCIAWFKKHGVSMAEDQLKICKHLPANGIKAHRIRDVNPEIMSLAERLLSALEPVPGRILNKADAIVVSKPKAAKPPQSYVRTASR